MDNIIRLLQDLLGRQADNQAQFLDYLREQFENKTPELLQVLQYMHNISSGLSRTAIISANNLNAIQNRFNQQDFNTFIQQTVQSTANNIFNTLNNGTDRQITTLTNQLANSFNTTTDAITNQFLPIILHSLQQFQQQEEQLARARERYNQALIRDAQLFENAGLGERIVRWLRSDPVTQNRYRREFTRDVNSQARIYRNQGFDRESALDRAVQTVQDQYGRIGIQTAQFINPDQPGGSAAQATERQKFIKSLVNAIASSPFGQRLSNLASDVATMGTLALASKFPALQKILLGALALGIPQSLGPLLGWGLTMAIDPTKRAMLATGIQMAGTGARAVGGFIGAGAQLAGGALATGARFAGSAVMGLGSNIGTMIGAIAPVIAPFLPIIGIVVGVGLAVAGIWALFKWWKKHAEDKDENPGWLDKLFNWWQEHMPAWAGGGNGGGLGQDTIISTPEEMANHKFLSTINAVTSGTSKLSEDHFGGKLLNTQLYSKEKLNKLLADNPAYESLVGGGKGWQVSQASFINDVMYAPTGTKSILNSVIEKDPSLFGKLILTSALGSSSSPHKAGARSHYIGGGKLDFSLDGMNRQQAEEFRKKLLATGYFDFANIEGDHIDAKISEAILRKMSDDYKKSNVINDENKAIDEKLKKKPTEITAAPRSKTYISALKSLVDSTQLNKTLTGG